MSEGQRRPPAPFQIMWAEYVHRVKVHELLRCLEVEQKKLRVLRDHLNIKDLADEPEGSQATRERKIVFQQPLETEKAQAEEIAEDVRKSKEEPDYISNSMIRLFDNNQTITDEQFEKILELCKDDQERKQLEEAYMEKRNREKYLSNATEDRRMLYNFLNSEPMQMFMLIVIFISTLVLFLLSFEMINVFYSYGLIVLDSIIMSVFIVEAGLKIYIYKDDYFKSPPNCLDLIIIITHFVEILVDLATQTLAVSTDISASLWFKLLKSLRSLRVLRSIKFLPSLQVIITTIIQSLMSISSIAALMLLFMFVFAVAGRELFREGDEKRFGDFAKTSLTLFQLLTLDDWGDILEDNNYELKMFIYLFLYIVCEYFVFLNLFVAVLVDNFQLSIEAAQTVVDENEEKQKWADRIDDLMDNLSDSAASLHSRHQDPVRELGIDEYFRLEKDSEEAKLLASNLKKLTSIDFQYHIWNRRMRLTSAVLEAAATDRSVRIGHSNVEIPGVDVIEPHQPHPEDTPLKPSRVARKRTGIAADSNFQLQAKKPEKKKKKDKKKSTQHEKGVEENKKMMGNNRVGPE